MSYNFRRIFDSATKIKTKGQQMSLITIDQLLESVDLNFEPRWVTKDLDGEVNIWEV